MATEDEYDEEALDLLGLDEEEKRPKKPMFFFQSIGLLMPVWGVLTLEREMRWEEKPRMHPIYCIVINRGMEPSQMTPIGERCLTFEKEETMVRKYNEILGAMSETAYKVITV